MFRIGLRRLAVMMLCARLERLVMMSCTELGRLAMTSSNLIKFRLELLIHVKSLGTNVHVVHITWMVHIT